MVGTIWSIVPPILAIALALITKEVYFSLFAGICVGALFYANFNIANAMSTTVTVMSDKVGGNICILIFLVLLGMLVSLMQISGASGAYGDWATNNIKTRRGARAATAGLGVLIFVDDYFNCLTVGSVMRPVTDKHKVSREKLAYLIDATAAPVCIIAPISSWAAAVTGFVEGANGLELFIRAIPYNFYAFLTFVMMITIAVTDFDFGKMAQAEKQCGITDSPDGSKKHPSLTGAEDQPNPPVSQKGKVIHLVLPIACLIVCCIIGMIYTGGFFEGEGFVSAFSNADASTGLVFGSMVALLITIIFYLATRVLDFNECMNAIPEGFKSMVPAILILTLAWTLKAMTDSLGASEYVGGLVEQVAENTMVMGLLPAFVFIIGAFLAFATGTSWGTFGMLIPIVVSAFHSDINNELMIIAISACMAGAVCGDHCSPISDTTIMASAGGQCEHIKHVSTQLPYAITVAAVSVCCYIMSGFVRNWLVTLPISIVLMILVLIVIRRLSKNK